VAHSADELLARADPPVFVKAPIGTASSGVWRAGDRASLAVLASRLNFATGIVVQAPAVGRLAMIQAVFADGELVVWHANTREREGVHGGSIVKCSIAPPTVAADLRRLGHELGWHGALSLDAVLTDDGPSYIDLNPRLVEPGNAWRAGVDLVGTLLAVSLAERPAASGPGRSGVRTHQLLLGVLDAAARGRRREVARELVNGIRRRGPYADSHEELTPTQGDPRAAVPVALVAGASLLRPALGASFSRGAVSSYALTGPAWERIQTCSKLSSRPGAPAAASPGTGLGATAGAGNTNSASSMPTSTQPAAIVKASW
jgi:hypothetical protein